MRGTKATRGMKAEGETTPMTVMRVTREMKAMKVTRGTRGSVKAT